MGVFWGIMCNKPIRVSSPIPFKCELCSRHGGHKVHWLKHKKKNIAPLTLDQFWVGLFSVPQNSNAPTKHLNTPRNIKLLMAWVGTKTARYQPLNHTGWYIILSLTVRKEIREIRSEREMLFKQQSKGTGNNGLWLRSSINVSFQEMLSQTHTQTHFFSFSPLFPHIYDWRWILKQD